jgi:hypothetical protein
VTVNVRFSEEDVWLTQQQLAEIYDTTQQNIAGHIKNIYDQEELVEKSTHKKFLLVRPEGNRQVKRNIYRKREMQQLESDFDNMIKNLPKQ